MEKEVLDLLKPMLAEQAVEMKKLINEPFEFLFEKPKKVEIKKTCSGKMVDETISILKGANLNQFQKFVDGLNKERETEMTVPDLIHYVENNKSPYDKFQVINYYSNKAEFKDYAEIQEQRRIDIEIFKLIIDRKQLTTEEQELINSNWDSDFWSEQDAFKIKQLVVFFRAKNGL
jgi:hypothetical protein